MSQLMDPKTVALIEPVFDLANRRLRGEISAEEWEGKITFAISQDSGRPCVETLVGHPNTTPAEPKAP